MEKSAGISLEFKDLDTNKRTAVIKHAVYTSIDRVKDISTKGMFTKSWNEGKPDFLFNHIEGKTVGSVKSVYDDDSGAYTEVKFGNWTLGNDVLEMAEEGVLKGASFGYKTVNKQMVDIKGQKIRKLTEVKHIETSLLTVLPAHPEAGVVMLNKAFEQLELKTLSQAEQDTLKSIVVNDLENVQSLITLAKNLEPNSDLYSYVMYMISRRADVAGSAMDQLRYNAREIGLIKSYVDNVESYCRKAKASDETILSLQNGLTEYKQIISSYDTAITLLAKEPTASDDEVKNQLSNFLTSFNLRQWQKQKQSRSN